MRITCPHCGERDLREFTCKGDALALLRPSGEAKPEDWVDYLHNRDNPAGPTRELWYHDPCSLWLAVERNTVTHEVLSSTPAKDAR